MRRFAAILTLTLLLGILAAPAVAGKHEDKELGYSFMYPRKWEPMKFGSGSKWVVARFESDKEYVINDPQGWGASLTPRIDVILIPLGLKKRGGTTAEINGNSIRIKDDVPWTNLREYLEEACKRIGGFHFSKEEETEINGMKVLQYEITVDKLVRGERRVYGWAFHTSDAIYGLVCQVAVQHEKKLKPMIFGSFKTLKTFQRSGVLPNAETTPSESTPSPLPGAGPEAKRELTPEQKKKKREDATKNTLKRVTAELGREWKVKKGKNYIAVSHADVKYTQMLLKHAEVLRSWLDKHLEYFGDGYTGKVIITICANSEERSQYLQARGWSSDNPEIVTYQDKGGWSEWAMESLNRGILDQWIKDKNDDLRWGAPSWIDNGLADFIETARLKGRGLEFAPDTWENQKMKELRRDGKLLKALEFFTLTSDEIWGNQDNWAQTQFFVKFLLIGSASRSKKYKTVFKDYVGALIAMLAEAKAAEEADDGSDEAPARPQTEEEEDEAYRKRQDGWRTKEKENLQDLLRRAFADWEMKDWDKLNSVYQQEIR